MTDETLADVDTEHAEDTATEESVDKTDKPDEGDEADEPTETADEASESAEPEKPKRRIQWARVLAFGVLPSVALLLAMGAGYLKWMDNSARVDDITNAESPARQTMQAAKESIHDLSSSIQSKPTRFFHLRRV